MRKRIEYTPHMKRIKIFYQGGSIDIIEAYQQLLDELIDSMSGDCPTRDIKEQLMRWLINGSRQIGWWNE